MTSHTWRIFDLTSNPIVMLFNNKAFTLSSQNHWPSPPSFLAGVASTTLVCSHTGCVCCGTNLGCGTSSTAGTTTRIIPSTGTSGGTTWWSSASTGHSVWARYWKSIFDLSLTTFSYDFFPIWMVTNGEFISLTIVTSLNVKNFKVTQNHFRFYK